MRTKGIVAEKMECSTSLLYGVFVSEKSFLIGIRNLVSDDHANLLAFKVCDGRVPQELINMVENELIKIGRDRVDKLWQRHADKDRSWRVEKFSFHGPRTMGQTAVFEELESMGISAMPVDNDRPHARQADVPARAQYIHLSAVKTRPSVSIQLPGDLRRSPLPLPSSAFNPLHYITRRGAFLAACGTLILRAVFRRESIKMDRVTYYTNPSTPPSATMVSRPSSYTARLLRCDDVKEAMQQWDGAALRQFVELLGLRIVPHDEDAVGDAVYEPARYWRSRSNEGRKSQGTIFYASGDENMVQSKQYLQSHSIADAHPTDIFSLAVTPSQLLSAAGSSSIKIYSTKGQIIHTDSVEDEVPYPLVQTLEKVHPLGCHHICTSLDGKVAASIGFGGELKLWKYNDESAQWASSGHLMVQDKKAGEHWAVALNEDGRFLACTTHDGRINVYDTSTITPEGTATQIAHYETKGSFGMSVDISSDGNMTASGHQNGSVYIFNNATQRLVHSLSGLVKPVRSVKFSPACRYLAAAGDARIIALYDTQSGEQVANLTGHASWIMSLDWNWSGEFLLSGCYDGKGKIWSMERRECVATQTESEKCLWSVKWLPKAATTRNETFVTAGAGRTLAFYREASGT
nr:meiotic recombination protein rec14 [Quercus suber]